jgi:hypothetical protein
LATRGRSPYSGRRRMRRIYRIMWSMSITPQYDQQSLELEELVRETRTDRTFRFMTCQQLIKLQPQTWASHLTLGFGRSSRLLYTGGAEGLCIHVSKRSRLYSLSSSFS